MRVKISWRVLFAAFALFIVVASAHAQAKLYGVDNPNRILNRYIVVLNDKTPWAYRPGTRLTRTGIALTDASAVRSLQAALESDTRLVTAMSSDMARTYGGTVLSVYQTAIKGFYIQMTDDAARRMAQDPRIESISADEPTIITTTQTNAPWHLDRVDQRLLPLDTNYRYIATGANSSRPVFVYILDTGLQTNHAEFGGRATPGVDWPATISQLGDVLGFTVPASPTDCSGHGTHIGGIIGGATYGVAKGVRLISHIVTNCTGSGQVAYLTAAINYIARTQVPSLFKGIIHMSLSTLNPSSSPALLSAIGNAMDAGLIFTATSGVNIGGTNSCNYLPAAAPGMIAIGSSGRTDRVSSFSPGGTCVTAFAPGEDVRSAWPGSSASNGFGCTIVSGTSSQVASCSGISSAAAHAAGIAALYLQNFPNTFQTGMRTQLQSAATPGILSNIPSGPPNLLLTTAVIGNPIFDPEIPPPRDPPCQTNPQLCN